MENRHRHQPNQKVEVGIISNGPRDKTLRRAQHQFCCALATNAQPQTNHKKALVKPKLKGILQNNGLALS